MIRRLFYNKRDHIDAREALSVWSGIKTLIDTLFVVFGAKTLFAMPHVDAFSLVFLLFIWTTAKECLDLPLVLVWLYGRISHIIRKHKRLKKRRKRLTDPSI